MKILVRILRYLAPSKGKIVLVVVLSILSSVFSVVSIYSVLPLLNAIFSQNELVQTPSETLAADEKPAAETGTEHTAGQHPGETTAEDQGGIESLKKKITEVFESVFYAETRERTLLNICLFLIAAFFFQESLSLPQQTDHFCYSDKGNKKTPR